MGLAATQARFLAITSRKARCEYESMQLAQQKLSLTRELEQATQDYQSALNTTKIVWDPDGSGTVNFDLSYDLIMYSSEVNNYTPFMISRSDGRIALNAKMAQAAKLAGIPEQGTGANDDLMFRKFIEAMVATGGMSETAAKGTRTYGYQRYAGLGGALMDKTQTADMNLGNLINYIDLRVEDSGYQLLQVSPGIYQFSEDYELTTYIPKANSNVAEDHYYNYNKEHTKVEDLGIYPVEFSEYLNFSKDSNYLSINGTRVSNKEDSVSYTLSDLLTQDITLAFTKKSKNDDPTRFWKEVLGNTDSFLNASTILDGKADLIDLIGIERKNEGGTSVYYYNGKKVDDDDRAVLDAVNGIVLGFKNILNIDNSDAEVQAFNYAILEVLGFLSRSQDLGNANYVSDTYQACIDGSNDYNCWVYKNSSKLNNANTRAISISRLAESFLTLYASAQNGFQPYNNNEVPYYLTDSAIDSFYVTDDQGYLYPVDLLDEDKHIAEEMYNAEYYSILFNTICRNGWYENGYIDDEDYLQNALKNGQVFVTTLNEEDGFYYQQRFNNNPYLMEVTDEDAVTQAESEYTQLKSRINYKEEELELDMKNLDMEISTLTTEYDSVKNMLTQNVTKTFTMFEN